VLLYVGGGRKTAVLRVHTCSPLPSSCVTTPAMQSPRSADDPLAGRGYTADGGTQPSAMSQQTFDHSTVGDSARAHFGNSFQNYYGTVYQSASSATPLTSGTLGLKIRNALRFDGMDMRRATIKFPHGSTCEWLFDSPEYEIWRHDSFSRKHHGFLWIRGKPGAGKSTLMRLAVKHADRKFPDDLRISFFFNAKGLLLERSVEGMYRSLIHQLLIQYPVLENQFHQREWTHPTWPVELLEEHFRDCVLQLGIKKLTCHIDALDECEESDVRGVVEFFQDLGAMALSAGVRMHVCFASRHYPRISMSNCLHLVLDKLKGHQEDIETYVRNNLKVPEPTLRDEYVKEITARACDVFLWVVLVVRLLNGESDRGCGHRLRAQLDALPDGLHRLFEDAILQRGADDNEHFLPTLLLLLFAQRPLTPLELYHGVLSVSRGTDGTIGIIGFRPNPDQIKRFVLSASKGLAEITEYDIAHRECRVQFIHETVREYLQNSGVGRIESSMCNNPEGLSHDFLKTRCADYISLAARTIRHLENLPGAGWNIHKYRRNQLKDTLPFLQYAFEHLVAHAELAQIHGVSQVTFLEAFPCDILVKLSNLITLSVGDEYYPSATRTYIFAQSKAPRLLQLELSRVGGEIRTMVDVGTDRTVHPEAVVGSCQGYWGFPLNAAINTGCFSTIKLLLDYGSDVNARGGQQSDNTALGLAIHSRCKLNCIKLLLQRGADVNARGDGSTALQLAAFCRDTAKVILLLEHGADVNAKRQNGLTALQIASVDGSLDMVRLLLGHGADADAEAGPYGSALQAAIASGSLNLVKCLVEHDAGINARRGKHDLRTAFRLAEREKEQEIAHYLKEHGACDDDDGT
jgi:hypothetical protein